MIEVGSKVGIICCSDGQSIDNRNAIKKLIEILKNIGLNPICSKIIYMKDTFFSESGKDRAEALMDFYKDDEIKGIFDISGGDIANEVLEYLDFQIIGKNNKTFFGYSDLTTIINAIYAKSKKSSCLYQVRNLIYAYSDIQISNFTKSIIEGKNDLYDIKYNFLQGEKLEGIVVGGNIRCFLKLAGTEYMPDFTDKILLLEAFNGKSSQIITYLTQLRNLNILNSVKGIIIGTFTESDKLYGRELTYELIKKYIKNKNIPIVVTDEIGHNPNSKGIMIGEYRTFRK